MRDLRDTPLYRELEAWYERVYAPGGDAIVQGAEAHPTPDGELVAFTRTRWSELAGAGTTAICVAETATGAIREISPGPRDRLPRWSPDGRRLAYLSDCGTSGRIGLRLAERETLAASWPAPALPGDVESYAWAPSGRRLLLCVVEDDRGAQDEAWLPEVVSSERPAGWRRCFVHSLFDDGIRQLSPAGTTVWEASWAGEDRIVALVSDGPDEDRWRSAELVVWELPSSRGDAPVRRTLYRSPLQLGVPCGSPSGTRACVLEAFSSSRGSVAGTPILIDLASGETRALDAAGVDVTCTTWRSDDVLFFVGHRGLDVVAGEIDVAAGRTTIAWTSEESCGTHAPEAWPAADGRIFTIVDGYHRYGDLVVVERGRERTIASFEHAGSALLTREAGTLSRIGWPARDGREIEGLLVTPDGPGPHPLVVHMHGGPVACWRNQRAIATPHVPALAARGYAVLHPNPRGSSGRGQEFALLVKGDIAGEDAHDVLCGIDHLVARGVADPQRLGLMGPSYGGYLTCWLITQDQRFAAAVALSPVTDRVTHYFTSLIPSISAVFLDAEPLAHDGKFAQRSPLTHVDEVRTPLLLTAGARDRVTLPSQALVFHRALAERGVATELAIYPQESHAVRSFPAIVDHTTRIVTWFERFMPATA